MYELQKQDPGIYLLPKEGNMRVPGLIIGNDKLLADEEMQKPLEQVANVATLQGILGYSIAMPDMHWGYGFPIGGVAAMDVDTGVISPGGVGYDINCGVRLALVPVQYESLDIKQKTDLLNRIFHSVPSGVGHGRSKKLNEIDYKAIAAKGAKWSIEQGFGFALDLDHMESYGVIQGADVTAVSALAKQRGAAQLGSIGSGNHFVEIGAVETIYLPEIAAAWGVSKGATYILIHSGSRGFGHQICQDTLDAFMSAGFAKGLPDKQLVAAPLKSAEGQHYFAAMATAANFAFNNRQQILHHVRHAFNQVLKIPSEEILLLYDVCHNIAKIETHEIEGKSRKVCVHRKGATRAFGPGHPELNPLFKHTGQPVLVPGDMGRASHLMVGKGNPLTFCSCCHGAGRTKSRVKALREWGHRDLVDYMRKQGVLVKASSMRTIAEEMPNSYKEVDEVVDVSQEAGLANKVARLKPGMVLKG
jgi:tRNA-splicing ligase RtcB